MFNKPLFRCILFFLLLHHNDLLSQSIPISEVLLNDYLRREQLTNSLNNTSSFCLQPLHYQDLEVDTTLEKWRNNQLFQHPLHLLGEGIEWLPISFTQQYNSHHPYGWNDGSMIPARGYQVLLSAGFFAKKGHFSLQLQPEFVWAENKDFPTFYHEQYDPIWGSYYLWLNRIDNPEKFGDKRYQKIFPGQSSLRYNSGNLSMGISTESLWWGPGRRNSLIMSNNAPGFLHLTLNTLKPIQTKIGSFEGQLILGKLDNSTIFPPDTNRVNNGIFLYQPKTDKWRYMTGLVMTWQPKWVKGLFLGFAKASYQYHTDVSGLADILPLEGLIVSGSEKQNKKASLGSIFMRYNLPGENAELYVEYGRNDRSASIVNLLTDKNYPAGYIVGLRKVSNLSAHNSRIEFAAEFTQLQVTDNSLIQQAKSWYTSGYVRQGFTNDGQVIGSGLGPGGNSEMIDISWIKGMTKIGLLFERVVHNNDFYYNAFVATSDYTRHWIDLSTTFHADWKYKRFIFSSEAAMIRSINYEWWEIPNTQYFKYGYDVLNFHGRLSFSYRL